MVSSRSYLGTIGCDRGGNSDSIVKLLQFQSNSTGLLRNMAEEIDVLAIQ